MRNERTPHNTTGRSALDVGGTYAPSVPNGAALGRSDTKYIGDDPRGAPKRGMMVARADFVAWYEGQREIITAGKTMIEGSHPIVRENPRLFEHAPLVEGIHTNHRFPMSRDLAAPEFDRGSAAAQAFIRDGVQ